MRLWIALLLLTLPTWADGTQVPRSQRVRSGLAASDRATREEAARLAREWARTDPAAVDALAEGLEVRARAGLVRALAGTGTRNGAQLALRHVQDPEDVVFGALVRGLIEGGERAILTEAPADIVVPFERAQVLRRLRIRYETEKRFAALKSDSGRTGHFAGQYAEIAKLGPVAVEVMWHIVRNRGWPLPGEASGEPYEPIHEGMLDFDPDERRQLAAYSFGELVKQSDREWIARIYRLFTRYFSLDKNQFPIEREELAPALGYSLHDLGFEEPAMRYIRRLRARARRYDFDGLQARWDLGYAYMRIDKPEEGEKWYLRVIELQSSDFGRGVACYNLACHFALRAGKARNVAEARKYRRMSLRWLQDAIENHLFIDWVWMEEDGDLNAIREEPLYKKLRDDLRRRFPKRKKGRKIEKETKKFLEPQPEMEPPK
ncbi:MAG: hypothetical protein AAGD14_09100 [Planctomycetota bacterium]